MSAGSGRDGNDGAVTEPPIKLRTHVAPSAPLAGSGQNKSTLPTRRQMSHLIGMCDGKRHVFLDHELARDMKQAGWIYLEGSYWRIADAGVEAVKLGKVVGQDA